MENNVCQMNCHECKLQDGIQNKMMCATLFIPAMFQKVSQNVLDNEARLIGLAVKLNMIWNYIEENATAKSVQLNDVSIREDLNFSIGKEKALGELGKAIKEVVKDIASEEESKQDTAESEVKTPPAVAVNPAVIKPQAQTPLN